MKIIYLIQAGAAGPIKIGAADLERLQQRISQMQTGNHELLTLRGLHTGGPAEQAALQNRLHRHRIRGDWFQPAALDDLNDAIATLNNRHAAAIEPVPFDRDAEARRVTIDSSLGDLRALAALARTGAAT